MTVADDVADAADDDAAKDHVVVAQRRLRPRFDKSVVPVYVSNVASTTDDEPDRRDCNCSK